MMPHIRPVVSMIARLAACPSLQSDANSHEHVHPTSFLSITSTKYAITRLPKSRPPPRFVLPPHSRRLKLLASLAACPSCVDCFQLASLAACPSGVPPAAYRGGGLSRWRRAPARMDSDSDIEIVEPEKKKGTPRIFWHADKDKEKTLHT